MSKVWFAPFNGEQEESLIANKVVSLYKAADFNRIFSSNEFTAVKIHFGEKNNTGYIKPQWIKPLLEKIKGLETKPFLTDTNTLYRGQRFNSFDHLIQAHNHGFSINNLGVPVIIADDLLSKNY